MFAYTTGTLVAKGGGYLENTQTEWLYSTGDALAAIQGAGYVTDASNKRMKVGDLVYCINPTGPKYILQQVSAISAAGAATLATPTAIS